MDTLLGLRTWKWRAADWTAPAVCGIAAGAVLMLADLRGGDTLAAHVVFGCVAGLLYWRLKRTRAET